MMKEEFIDERNSTTVKAYKSIFFTIFFTKVQNRCGNFMKEWKSSSSKVYLYTLIVLHHSFLQTLIVMTTMAMVWCENLQCNLEKVCK